MKFNFLRTSVTRRDIKEIFDILIEINYLAIVFFIPLYFAYLFPTYNIFEFNKLILFKVLVWTLLFLSGLKILFFSHLAIFIKENKKNVFLFFKKYLLLPSVFIIGLGISLFFSINPTQSFFGSYDRQEGFISYLFYFIWFLLLFYNLTSFNQEIDRKKIERIIKVAVISSLLVSVYGILQTLNIDFIAWAASPLISFRAASTFGQPNFLASYLLLVVPLNVYLLINSKKLLEKFSYFLIADAQVLCLFFTASRGALVSLVIVILAASFFWLIRGSLNVFKKIFIILGLLMILVIGGLGLEYFSPGRVSNLTNLQYGSTAVRVIFYKASVSAITQKPLFGYGLENGNDIFIKYYKPDWGVWGDVGANTDRAHNLILDILLSSGIVGLIVFFGLYYQLFYLTKKNIKKEGLKSLSPFLFLGIIAYLISLLFSFAIVGGEVYVWLYLAILSSISVANNQPLKLFQSVNINSGQFHNKLIKKIIKSFYYFVIISILTIIVCWGINFEKRNLIADYYFNKLYFTLAEKKYFDAVVLNSYIAAEKPNKVNKLYYDQFLAAKMSDVYPGILAPADKYVVRKDLLAIRSSLETKGYKNLFALAKISGALGDIDSSQKYFSALELITPYWPFIYLGEGQAYYANKMYQPAIKSYMTALSDIPDSNDPRLKNNNDEHQKDVSTYYYVFNREIGNCYFMLHDYPQAEIYFNLAYSFDPSDFSLFKKIADTYYLRGDLKDAIAYTERGFNRNPKDYNWPLSLAILYHESGNKEKAVYYINLALSLSPNDENIKLLKDQYSH